MKTLTGVVRATAACGILLAVAVIANELTCNKHREHCPYCSTFFPVEMEVVAGTPGETNHSVFKCPRCGSVIMK